MQTHPNARLYRGRIVENLDNLQIIFGNDSAFEFSPRNSDALLGSTPGYEDVEATDTFQIQSSCTKEQTRHLIWTKEMDCCSGNILVKQYKEGNKLDSNLKSRVCTDAVTAINKKFHLDLTKDHIRNRLKTWKKQYGILKELLDQEGFTWDETRKMVVADDSAWDDYIKTHRDARPFRGRVCENYDHLCIIFGNNYTMGSYSRTADDIVHSLAGDSDGMEGICVSPLRYSGSMKDQAKTIWWTNEMDCCLCMILVEQLILGKKK
ncbi:uncharacterized protein At2g29880-like [Camellia sinensis]|uniref:uncharacterized protein At2g29880-like n=1 Tax=Camellia sinensis TaxID=4442 RepID=UPI0010364BE9|nr:uncharacterized protein At2g29880-like [Camellia sinensis]